jgi:hypothetical protein
LFQFFARTEAADKSGLGYHYTPRYLKRFIGRNLQAAFEAIAGDAKVLAVLPDQWQLGYAPNADGEQQGFHRPEFDDSGSLGVRTYSDTLGGQGHDDRGTIMWYRTQFQVPREAAHPRLFFFENDGTSDVFVNGEKAGSHAKSRDAFSVDGSKLRKDSNHIAIRIDHSKMTELDLGGMIRPVYLIGERQ